mmetsp:Transcript_29030/g.48736  ORF Transcript_29030/g.48736 Transcript_29030/m.48736 type:complete len:546 (+) Transcript_29030:148-1785(+)
MAPNGEEPKHITFDRSASLPTHIATHKPPNDSPTRSKVDDLFLSISPVGADAEPGVCVQISPDGRFCRYDKKVVAKGSFKEVYKGLDTNVGKEVAWNIVNSSHSDTLSDQKHIERLEREFQIMKSLDNPHVVKCFDGWRSEDGQINFITELFTSGNLRVFRQKHPDVNLELAINKWGREILIGINYLHSQTPPIIHRDLRCEYVFINGNSGEVKIADLGRAKFRTGANTLLVSGGTIDTPASAQYYAPEMYDGVYDESVDIYAFGLLLMELATLRRPYDECTSQAEVFRTVSAGTLPEAVHHVKDRDLKAVITGCLKHDASQRPTAGELLELDYFRILDPKDIIHVEGVRNLACSNMVDLKLHIPVHTDNTEMTLQKKVVKFEFDVTEDTAKAVAAEMMAELDLTSYEAAVVTNKINDVISEVTDKQTLDDLTNTMKLVRIPDHEPEEDPKVTVIADPNDRQKMQVEFYTTKDHRELFFNVIHALHALPLDVSHAVYTGDALSTMGAVIDEFYVRVWDGHQLDPKDLHKGLMAVHAEHKWDHQKK